MDELGGVFTKFQEVVLLAGMVIFMTIPNQGKKHYIELGLILFFAILAEAVAALLVFVVHTNPNAPGNILTIIIFPLAVSLYTRSMQWKNKKTLGLWIAVLFMIAIMINLYLEGLTGFNTFGLTLDAGCFIILTLVYFYSLIRELPTESITKLPMFWINTAFLIFNAGNFFIYLSSSYLIKVLGDDLNKTWIVHNFLGVVYYFLLAYGLWLIRSQYLRTPA